MRHRFHAEQWLPYPVEHVFAFFGDPENLPRLMPAWQKARIDEISIQTPPLPPDGIRHTASIAGAGTRMTLSFRLIPLSPVRTTWDAEIDQFAWNNHFCDTQRRGPFAFWHHCHRFEHAPCSRGNGASIEGTWVLDELEYELPFGIVGELAHNLAVLPQIRSLFRYRHQCTEELLRG